jgi:hypothetical protein
VLGTDSRARLQVKAQRIDGHGDATIYDPFRTVKSIGLRPIDLVLSKPGCWRVSARRRSALRNNEQ